MVSGSDKMGKKGALGVGVLFILIAVLLIAVVFSLIYVKTSQSMVNRAGDLFDRTKSEASSAIKILEIAGIDGRDGYLSDFTMILRLLPGSSGVSLDECSLMVSSGSDRAILRYREGGDLLLGNSGYNTWTAEEFGTIEIGQWYVLEEDLDDDGLDDYFRISATHAYFNLSSTLGNQSVVQLMGPVSPVNIAAGDQVFETYGEIEEQGTVYGYLSVEGFNPNTTLIDASVDFHVIPAQLEKGYYTLEYIARSGVPVEGVLGEGDTVQLYFQGFSRLQHDEFISFNFLCPTIIPIEKTVFTGNTIPRQRKVIIYPQI